MTRKKKKKDHDHSQTTKRITKLMKTIWNRKQHYTQTRQKCVIMSPRKKRTFS